MTVELLQKLEKIKGYCESTVHCFKCKAYEYCCNKIGRNKYLYNNVNTLTKEEVLEFYKLMFDEDVVEEELQKVEEVKMTRYVKFYDNDGYEKFIKVTPEMCDLITFLAEEELLCCDYKVIANLEDITERDFT